MRVEKTLRTPAALAGAGLIAPADIAPLETVAARYAVAITPYLAQQIAAGGPELARQYLPDPAELDATADERADPIGDHAHMPVKGIVHRYGDRALLKITHVCAVYCRFCFRREMVGPGGEGALNPTELAAALAYVAEHQEIWEVIVTGGDPLVLSPRRLAELMAGLGGIDHVKVVRFHTRLPVVDPAAVTDDLVAALSAPGKAVYVALHANHPDELTPEARAACAKMIDAGIAMVSQSVLLRGINDDAAVLGALMRAFVETRIKPYYLHQGDLAPGTSHLRVPISEGQALMRALRGDYSGLCQPTYVLDIPGGHGKSPIGPAYVEGCDGAYEVEDPQGVRHAYPPKA
ncbi:MAG: lysine-2,3-aminomutase-like protein [Phenylobacterium sp.]|nr:lysine-2,3-aminomutase-like protein [Phenylobacterium sp.]